MEDAAVKAAWDTHRRETNQSPPFEIVIVCDMTYLQSKIPEVGEDPVRHLQRALTNTGLIIERENGLVSECFLKVAAPLEVIGRAAEKLRLRKPTHAGLDVIFDWEQRDAFVRQPLGDSLFSWTERYQCLSALINTVRGVGDQGEPLMKLLKHEGIVKEVFPLHQEQQRKWLLEHWAFNWREITFQPIDAINLYFGAKVAIYFAFLGMYTRWLVFPTVLGFYFYFINHGTWEAAVPPLYSIFVVVWAVVFLQFWRRRNADIQARWGVPYESEELQALKTLTSEQQGSLFSGEMKQEEIFEANVSDYEAKVLGKEEWLGRIRSVKNNLIVITIILCVQLPFELLYAHLNRIAPYDFLKYILTGIYILAIQYFTKAGAKVAMKLTKEQQLVNKEASANSLIYKVFGIYFLQSYIGLFYQALLQRDFNALRSMLAQRLIVSQLMSNVAENLVPYVTYRYAKYKAFEAEQELKKNTGEKIVQASRVEEEYLKPTYEASIASDFEDGLFDGFVGFVTTSTSINFLELAVQFGMVTMFASAYPLVAAFAIANNLVEIRSDSLKLLVTMRRPAPKAAASIGAWLAIFQNLGVVAIVTNCALLVCVYDDAGRWKIEPGLAAILMLEHLLLLAKFGFSWFVPEEPAWIKAKHIKKIFMQDHMSHKLLSILEEQRQTDLSEMK